MICGTMHNVYQTAPTYVHDDIPEITLQLLQPLVCSGLLLPLLVSLVLQGVLHVTHI